MKAYLNDKKELRATYRKNKAWKVRWLPLVKYDSDYDWEWLFAIVMRKLRLMHDWYSVSGNAAQADDSRLAIAEELGQALALGEEFLSFDDGERLGSYCASHKAFVEKHTKRTYGLISKDGRNRIAVCEAGFGAPKDFSGCADRLDAYKKAHPEAEGYWCGFWDEWDSEESQAESRRLSEEFTEKKASACKAFFDFIGGHLTEWWD